MDTSTSSHSIDPWQANDFTKETLPASGDAAHLMGNWGLCDVGKALDLDPNGLWVPSAATPEPGCICIGKNKHTTAVHVMIGIRRADNGFDVIYYDEDEILVGMTATYKPEDKLQWWHEQGSSYCYCNVEEPRRGRSW